MAPFKPLGWPPDPSQGPPGARPPMRLAHCVPGLVRLPPDSRVGRTTRGKRRKWGDRRIGWTGGLEDVEEVVRTLSGWYTPPASIIRHLQNELSHPTFGAHNSPLERRRAG